MAFDYDATIIGSGPNGLSAAIVLARQGYRVLVIEKHPVLGGGVRSEDGPLPGFRHDVCSAVYPMALCSPFFQELNLEKFGVEWVLPDIQLAHPLDDGSAAVMFQSVQETADQFEAEDALTYRRIFDPMLKHAGSLFEDLMGPPRLPGHPLAAARFGLEVLPSASRFINRRFSTPAARALFAGNAAHSVLPLDRPLTTNAIGIMLMLACHRVGWPIVRGGAESLTFALADCLTSYRGQWQCDREIRSFDDLPSSRVYIFDTGPHALAEIAGDQLPARYRKRLKNYRYGPGVFKVDFALSDPVPWTSSACRKAGTVHVGGTFEEIAEAESACWRGLEPERPFVLTAQQSLFDPLRAPEGKHTLWAYCHVPSGSTTDMTGAIENQIERFAPGFRDTILGKQTRNCVQYEGYNPNFVGGDVVGGVADWRQLLTRPVVRLKPHTTPERNIFLCSASTPPGGGVHGMGGYWAASEALKYLTRRH